MYDVLEEGQRNVLSLWPSNVLTPSRVEGKSQIHVRFTVIFFPLWHSVMHRNEAGRRLEVILFRITISAKL